MGWSFSSNNTKQQEIDSILSDIGASNTLRKHAIRGNNLWMLVDTQDTTVIVLALLESGYLDSGYGHKILDESCGPHVVDCPLSWLDLAPMPAGKYAAGWRDSVRAFHAKAQAKRQMAVGQVWRLCAGHNAPADRCELVAKRKRGWVGLIAGEHFQVMPRQLAEQVG